MVDCLFNSFPVAFEKCLDVSVRQISNPAPEAKAARHVTGKSAVKDTLHNSTDDKMTARLLHNVIITDLPYSPK